MKRLILLATILFVVSSSYGANKMSMVTYFPVPYVAYSQVSADQQLDVGLTSACNMNLGCNESEVNLKAHTVNLQKGKLELNNGKGVFGQSISLGTGNGSGQIRFNNVRMKGGEMQSLNAESMNVRSLELFGKPFPACKGKGGSDGQMKWQELALQGYSGTDSRGELYLVCGKTATVEGECEPKTPPNGETYTGQCRAPLSVYDTCIHKWNYATCQYDQTLKPKMKKCLVGSGCLGLTVNFVNTSSTQGVDSADVCSLTGLLPHIYWPGGQSDRKKIWQNSGYAGMYGGNGYIDSINCEAGKECPACTVGAQYAHYYHFGAACPQPNGQVVEYHSFAAASCQEIPEGEACPAENTSYSCQTWPGSSRSVTL